MSWFRKFSFDDIEEIQPPSPKRYDDIGHEENSLHAIAWMYINGKIFFGEHSHSDIIRKLIKEKGEKAASDIFMNSWRGRYDPVHHEMSMTVEQAYWDQQEIQPPPDLVMMLQDKFPDVERIWSFPGSRPVLGHFDDNALDRLYKFAWKHHFAGNYFEQGQKYQNPSDASPIIYMELDDHLRELFKVEYVIGELKRRGHLNQRISFSRRYLHWLQKLQDHALGIATSEVGPQMLHFIDQWLKFHGGSGFAEEIVGLESGASNIEDDGTIKLGGNFEYQIGEEVVEVYLKANPSFVREYFDNEWQDDEYLQEFIEQHGDSPLEWDDHQKFEYVKDSIESLGYTFEELRKWLEQWGDFDAALLTLIKTHVYPAWRTWWGDSIEVAERNVTESRERLEQSLETEDLGQILPAINLALNAQHVHGGMYIRMDLGQDLMDELSNLDTDELDEFVNMITGSDWKGGKVAKVAQYVPGKTPKFYTEEFEVMISDVDRYTADKYWITAQILESVHKYSIGLNIINSHVGIAGQGQYWHFKKNELSKAKKTFAEIKEIVQKLHDEIEYIRPPMAIIAPMFRSSMHYVDYPHRERSGVYYYNWFEELPKVADWRCSLYGERYPEPPTETAEMADSWINVDEQSKNIVVEGSPRNRQVYYKSASHEPNPEHDPLWLATFIGQHWKWTIPTATLFLTWFANVGGDQKELIESVQSGAQSTGVLRQMSQNGHQVSENVSEVDFEPQMPKIPEMSGNQENSFDTIPEKEYTEIDMGNFDGLDPEFSQKIKEILLKLTQKGWQPRVAEGLRSLEQQQEKIDQGRSSLKHPENSKHVQGLAVDIIDSRYGWNGPASDLNFEFWNDLGDAVREVGLTWGGDWKSFKDVAHVEAVAVHKKGAATYHWSHKYACRR